MKLYCTRIRVQVQSAARTEDDEQEDECSEDGSGDEHPVEAGGGARERALAARVGLERGAVGGERERAGRWRRDCGAVHRQRRGGDGERSGTRVVGGSRAPLEVLLEFGHQLRRDEESDRHAQLQISPQTRRHDC